MDGEDRKEDRHTGGHQEQDEGADMGASSGTARDRMETACKPQRHAVRVRMPEAQGQTPDEILKAVKPIIKGAYAIRTLRSGDIDVMVPDQKTKDAAINQQGTEGCKILRQDYSVEIAGVPLATRIESGKGANNADLIKDITVATQRIISNITISRIRWLHDAKGRETRMQSGKTNGTVILCLPTQALQHEVVKKGVVIHSQLYEARLFNHGIQIKQCFNCNQWGHTQSACGKQAKCGECAGSHQSKECPKERVSCVNCGRAHRAWQKKECRSYHT